MFSLKARKALLRQAWHTRACPTLSQKYFSKQSHVQSASPVFEAQPCQVRQVRALGAAVPCTLTGSLLTWRPRVCTLFHLSSLASLHPSSIKWIKTGNLYVSPSIQQHEVQSLSCSQPEPSRETGCLFHSVLWLCALGSGPARTQPILLPGCSRAQLPSLPGFLMFAFLPFCLLTASCRFLAGPCLLPGMTSFILSCLVEIPGAAMFPGQGDHAPPCLPQKCSLLELFWCPLTRTFSCLIKMKTSMGEGTENLSDWGPEACKASAEA